MNKFDIIDFSSFRDNIDTVIDKSNKLFEQSKFDDSIEILFQYARKMVYWGNKGILIKLLNKYKDSLISDINIYRKKHIILFANIVPFYNRNLNIVTTRNEFNECRKAYPLNVIYRLENSNLDGIFTRIYENNVDKAIELHNKSLMDVKFENETLNIRGKIYENLAICYWEQNNSELTINYLNEAYKCFCDSNDTYELAKYYYLKTYLLYTKTELFEKAIFTDLIRDFKNLNKIKEEYKFPDIERNFYNLFAKVNLNNDDITKFYHFKRAALDCDTVLYMENFKEDFISLLKVTKEKVGNHKEEVITSLDMIEEFLRNAKFNDEAIFINAVKLLYTGKDYSKALNTIKNDSLRKLYVKRFITD